MKKEINDLIYGLCEPYFSRLGFKIKKTNEGGVLYTFKDKRFECSGGFVFFSYTEVIDFIGHTVMEIKLSDVEKIYSQVLAKNNLKSFHQTTICKVDDGWKKLLFNGEDLSSYYIKNNDFTKIEDHVLKILGRFEDYMLPVTEQCLSLPYWVDFYEKSKELLFETNQVDSFYTHVSDIQKIKHLIMLKLAGSPSFEDAFHISFERVLRSIQEEDVASQSYERFMRTRNILQDLKEVLDATPPKYDLHDLTPPFRFEKREVVKSSKPDFQPEVILRGKKVNIDINGFEISPTQRLKIDTFLMHLENYYDKVMAEIISNAEYENESGDYTNDCGGTLFSIAEEAGLIETTPKGFEQEAAGYLYLRDVAIDLENDTAVFYLASDLNDLVLSAHVTLEGRVEMIHL